MVTYTSSEPLRGALAEVERVFVNAQTSSAKQRYLPYMRKQPCGTCGGSGYDQVARSVRLGGLTYPDLIEVEVREVRNWAKRVADDLGSRQREVGEPLLQDLGRRLGILDRLGLAHLQLSRSAATLSGGELQRTRLAAQLSTELSGIIFVPGRARDRAASRRTRRTCSTSPWSCARPVTRCFSSSTIPS